MKSIDIEAYGIRKDKIPQSIAIIMDGNGRWAKQRNCPRIEGHKEGIESVRDIVESCGAMGVKYLTLYTFSEENWKRPPTEIKSLLNLLAKHLESELDELNKNNVSVRFIGRSYKFQRLIRNKMQNLVSETQKNTGLNLLLALSYSGRAEIIDAVGKIIETGVKKIDEKSFKKYLYCPDLPDPDLLIRTSGEQRISNFLLYQIAYTEIFITASLWPDFRTQELLSAIKWYQQRKRKFGKLDEK